MPDLDWTINQLKRLPPGLNAQIENLLRRIPSIRRQMEQEYEKILSDTDAELHPYREKFPTYTRLPQAGCERQAVLQDMEALNAREQARWQAGFVSGAVYHGDPEHIEFLNRVYALHSQSNPLHADIWPSATSFEAQVVAMTASMMGGEQVGGVCGTLSSGGTESILLAMKTYRDRARQERGVKHPEVIVPVTAHAAFDKAAQYFNLKLVRIPVDQNCRADLVACKQALNRNTVAIVGSAPSFPHGAIDPIAELSELARQRGIGFHTDACLGGFVLPWARRLGYPVPPFDFSLPGVTSISVDTHKYGYAAKGTSVILYRTPELRRYQFYAVADWPGGLYFSPTFAGSRPGALVAAAWAALVTTGEDGYIDATRRILETAERIKAGIRSIPELRILGDPLWVIAFASDSLDIFKVMDQMTARHWSLNGLHHPPAVHLAITLRHTAAGVAERFVEDLKSAIDDVKTHPQESGGMAPVYGLAAGMPLKGVVTDLLKRYLEVLYKT